MLDIEVVCGSHLLYFALFLPCHLLTKTKNRGGDCIRDVLVHGAAVIRMKREGGSCNLQSFYFIIIIFFFF